MICIMEVWIRSDLGTQEALDRSDFGKGRYPYQHFSVI